MVVECVLCNSERFHTNIVCNNEDFFILQEKLILEFEVSSQIYLILSLGLYVANIQVSALPLQANSVYH